MSRKQLHAACSSFKEPEGLHHSFDLSPAIQSLNGETPRVSCRSVLFAVIFTRGVLVVDAFGCATLIALTGGLLHSFTSIIGPLLLPSWLVRGATADVFLKALKVYGSRPHPVLRVASAMTVSSLATGLFHYVVIIKALGLIPEPPFLLVLVIFVVVTSSTFVGSLVAAKAVNRLERPLK